jgi:WD40 repeat protein
MISSTLFCDTCGVANRAQAVFCVACGRRLHVPQGGTVSNTLTGLLTQQHTLNRRYRILSKIGTGGFGAVYRAADTQLGYRIVAIKEMSQSGLGTQELLKATEDFKREAHMLANLTHPHLPRIYEQFTDAGRWYLVMDFIDGQTLEELLSQVNGGRLPFERVLAIGIQLCNVLDYLHTRQPPIIFRDLKPANVMLTSNQHVFLIDFGIARHFKPGQLKDTVAFGSPGYAAPEQYGRVQTTPRSDIYSLGATLHQVLTGNDPSHTPFSFTLPQSNDQRVQALGRLLMRMVDMDASKRPESMTIVKQELQRIIANQAVSASGALKGAAQAPFHHAPTSSGVNTASQTNPSQFSSVAVVHPAQSQTLGTTLCVCCGHSTRVTSVAWSPDGTRIASAGFDRTVQIWNAVGGNSISPMGSHLLTYRGHTDRVLYVAWSPDSKRIASASVDRTVQVWDAATGKTIFTHAGHTTFAVNAIAWSPDGKLLASASNDKTIQIWDLTTNSRIYTYREHTAEVTTLAWSPDGKHIASAGNGKIVRVWEPGRETKQNILTYLLSSHRGDFTYSGHDDKIKSVTWSSDSKRIASASADKTVRVWDASTGRTLLASAKRSSGINAVVLSPDGKRVASGGNDKLVQVWNTLNGSHVFTYRDHLGYVTSLSWSPDGTRLASASVDRTVRVWQAI